MENQSPEINHMQLITPPENPNLMKIMVSYKPRDSDMYASRTIILPKGTKIEKVLQALYSSEVVPWDPVDHRITGEYAKEGGLIPGESYYVFGVKYQENFEKALDKLSQGEDVGKLALEAEEQIRLINEIKANPWNNPAKSVSKKKLDVWLNQQREKRALDELEKALLYP
jgi:hypothetical protein